MFRLKRTLTAGIWIIFSQALPGQHHYNAWFRTTVSYPLSTKIRVDAELQHRRQNGYDNRNMFDKELMFTFRSWVYYQHTETVRFSLSPFACFSHYRIIQNKGDDMAKPSGEIRFSAAVDLQNRILKDLYIMSRAALEYRVFESDQAGISRVRNRLGLRYDLTNTVSLTLYDELFCNLAGADSKHFFDHNRAGISMGYLLHSGLTLDIGYIHISRLPLSNETRLHESNAFLNLTYRCRQFRQKKAG